MRIIDIDQVEKGARLAKHVYNASGRMMLTTGTILTKEYLESLKRMGFTSLCIDDGFIDDVVIDDVITVETKVQAINCVRDMMEGLHQKSEVKVSSVKNVVANIVDDLIRNKEMMLNLSDIRSYDDYTFNHSVNVTVISIMIGMSLHYNQDKLYDLGLGVLLHDIGKTQIPEQIINKPDRLSEEEYEIVKQHTWHGFEVLRSNPEIKITSAHVALQHHERYNGSGYPRQLKGDNILEFARVSAIADVFDAMTNDRCYREKIHVHKVYEFLQEKNGIDFDQSILDRFIEKVALYPQGTKVVLSDGRSGFVIKQNYTSPSRPIVRLFWFDNSELAKAEEVNLLLHPSLTITNVIDK